MTGEVRRFYQSMGRLLRRALVISGMVSLSLSANAQSVLCPGNSQLFVADFPEFSVSDGDLSVGDTIAERRFRLESTPACLMNLTTFEKPIQLDYGVWARYGRNGYYDSGVPGIGVRFIWQAHSGDIVDFGSPDIPEDGRNKSIPWGVTSFGHDNYVWVRFVVTSDAYKSNVGKVVVPVMSGATRYNVLARGERGTIRVGRYFRSLSVSATTIDFRISQTCTLSDATPFLREVSPAEFAATDRVYASEFTVVKTCGPGVARPITYTITDALDPGNNTGHYLSKSPGDPETGVRLMLVRPGVSIPQFGSPWIANSTDASLRLRVDYQKIGSGPPVVGVIRSRATIRLDHL